MEVSGYMLVIILGSALVTVIPRVLPLMLLSRVQLPEWAMRWLHYVPVSVMAAMIGQELWIKNGELELFNLKVLAAVPTLLVAIYTRSLLGTVITGILTLMILRYWLG
ncbi:AzlD domain-containing protein [Paenibacillus sp. FSL K6-1230]|uniref:AzlD domain-containing protein n=1 Tax=Paenibacillus sp. FSL K6-1230 TaxID=2921603 RepID=UPI0030F66D7C